MDKYTCQYCKTVTDQNPCIKCGRRRPGRPHGSGTGKKPRITPSIKPETLEWLTEQPEPYGVTIDNLVKAERKRSK